jgi:hypothetical protein
MTGCTTSYHHLSNPHIDDDGYDLLCAGLEVDQKLRVAGKYCLNASDSSGDDEYVMVDVVWKWGRE